MAGDASTKAQWEAECAVEPLDQRARLSLAAILEPDMTRLTRWWLRQPTPEVEPVISEELKYRMMRRQLPDLLTQLDMEAAMAEGSRANDLGRLNDQLFAELENLRATDPTNAELMQAEVARSKAVEGIARTVIENANTVLAATRMRAEFGKQQVTMPKMLEG